MQFLNLMTLILFSNNKFICNAKMNDSKLEWSLAFENLGW
jgi:hypothetical protein